MKFFQKIIVLVSSILGISLGCQAQKPRTQAEFDNMLRDMYKKTVPLVRVEELKSDGMADYLLLDTREKKEFKISHIEGAKNVGYMGFKKKSMEGVAKDTPIIVYCSVGYRSERIGEKLQKMGFSNVKNLYGGIFEWKNKGNQVVGLEGKQTEKVHTYNRDWSQWLFEGEKIY